MQLLATNKCKKKNFSVHSVNYKHFKTTLAMERNIENISKQLPLERYFLVNSLLLLGKGRKWNKFSETFPGFLMIVFFFLYFAFHLDEVKWGNWFSSYYNKREEEQRHPPRCIFVKSLLKSCRSYGQYHSVKTRII